MLYFITGSEKKFREIAAMVPGLERLDLDLPEIQEIDARAIIRAKLREATAHHQGEFTPLRSSGASEGLSETGSSDGSQQAATGFIVEDTSFHLDCLNGLPGPLIKWFLKAIGADGLYHLAARYGEFGATARTIIGYARGHDDIHFFEGTRRGRVVPPGGDNGFGWDRIFVADGQTKTQAEMTLEEKNAMSQRAEAVRLLREFLAKGQRG